MQFSGLTISGGLTVSTSTVALSGGGGGGSGGSSGSYNMNVSGTSGGYIKFSPGYIIDNSAYTVECWFKLLYTPSERYFISGNGGFALNVGFANSTTIGVYNMPLATGSFTVPAMALNTWHNLVVTRTPKYTTYNDPFSADPGYNSGYYAVAVWLNGQLASSGVVANSAGTNYYTQTNNIIGWASGDSAATNFNGKIGSLRLSNVCRFFPYTGSAGNLIPVSTIAVPTSAYTADANTKFLLNPTGSTPVDGSGVSTISSYSLIYDSTDGPF